MTHMNRPARHGSRLGDRRPCADQVAPDEASLASSAPGRVKQLASTGLPALAGLDG
jgi:hypothetical protein